MRDALTFSELPTAAKFQIAVLGPILVGAICGFLLGESAAGWWIAQAGGAVGGVAGGFEHHGARASGATFEASAALGRSSTSTGTGFAQRRTSW